MIGFLTGIKTKLLVYLSIAMGILYIFWKVFEAGKTQQNVQTMKATINAVKIRNKIDNSVNNDSVDAVVERLSKNGWLDK